jgi:hypothetical protein
MTAMYMSSARWAFPLGACRSTVLVVALATPVHAQGEESLKAFFEGRHVVTRIDLPGTSDGVDVQVEFAQHVDYREYGERLKRYGPALRAGDSAVVTLVKVKKDLIEFQLGGGGYGTFGDDTSTSVYIPFVEKSSREKDLERLVREEGEDRRRRELERELDEIRERRERENRRIELERARASELKAAEVAERRLRAGSRFNVRFVHGVPAGVRPEDVMAALGEYVDFGSLGSLASAPQAAAPPALPPALPAVLSPDAVLRKGMARSDAERMLGAAQQAAERREGSLTVTSLVFMRGREQVTAEFVEDVLVHYTISSK